VIKCIRRKIKVFFGTGNVSFCIKYPLTGYNIDVRRLITIQV